ncbi:hypothetical protein I6A60_12435 [Frankia sp. AgB1.9]|uniref:hypothetical protein n=1 Tax=unclassified Frankia TaxID=2632575 RepID=UPI001932D3E0|nr:MULTISPECIES: hypothetical protein [unclassified Frankia]MBL7489386.1 hypothetical protein [Frankia sp. AgW1.1]MBL7548677.1 hypothetical protein [Frankia sp. AgB1.9]MBL7619275.1 hypothetical protein [Frankia sp. AgB1.8]
MSNVLRGVADFVEVSEFGPGGVDPTAMWQPREVLDEHATEEEGSVVCVPRVARRE